MDRGEIRFRFHLIKFSQSLSRLGGNPQLGTSAIQMHTEELGNAQRDFTRRFAYMLIKIYVYVIYVHSSDNNIINNKVLVVYNNNDIE